MNYNSHVTVSNFHMTIIPKAFITVLELSYKQYKVNKYFKEIILQKNYREQ